MNRIHGKEGTRIYDCWVNMKQRCLNPNHHTYPLYGGRGIKVCDSWLSFDAFYSDMGEMPAGGSIERLDPNGNYESSNCCWLDRSKQGRNTRKSIFVEMQGRKQHLKDWCEELNISYKTVFQRIKRDGMSPIDALTKKFRERTNG